MVIVWKVKKLTSDKLASMSLLSSTGGLLLGASVFRLYGVTRFSDRLNMGRSRLVVRCMSFRKTKEQPRGPLWKTRSVISKEVVRAVHDLKRAKDDPQELTTVFQTQVARLLKMDFLATLSELQRQNEISLSLQLFDYARKEMWYVPNMFLYRSIMDTLGRHRLINEVEKKFQELQDEGLNPDVVIYRELVGAYLRSNLLHKALEAYERMKELGFGDDELTNMFINKARLKTRIAPQETGESVDS